MSSVPIPPRRDPRILLLDVTLASYAVIDAWEVRSTGPFHFRSESATQLSLIRLVRRNKPSVIVEVLRSSEHHPCDTAIGQVASRTHLPWIRIEANQAQELLEKAPDASVICEEYPESSWFPSERMPTLMLAIACFTYLNLPARAYASKHAVSAIPHVRKDRPASARKA